jgi:predicted enzyme related to lactoylglutathione lyase
MTEPWDALRMPPATADPDPEFAARLRARVARALDLPRGVAVTVTAGITPTRAPAPDPAAAPAPAGAAVPYLNVRDGAAAIAWYVRVFGARQVGEPYVMPDGSIGHAELALGAGVVYLAEGDYPDIGVAAADPGAAASSVSLVLAVPGLDGVLATARGSGARVVREPYEGYGARNATIFDPFGHRWMLTEPIPAGQAAPAPQPGEPFRYRHGDTAYLSLWVPDVERAARFYGAVLGWEAVGEGPGRHVPTTTPRQGLWTSSGPPSVLCCYVVDDIAGALDRVTAAGGRAGAPSLEPYGTVASCADDQGAEFALVQLPAGHDPGATADPPLHGRAAGDVAYLVVERPDSAAARAFYGAVLGWEFSGGRVADGWNVDGVAPMTGLAGGADRPRVRPMYRVDDIAAAVARVREAGGTATAPAEQPYGLNAECVDDQGLAFYLGQLR